VGVAVVISGGVDQRIARSSSDPHAGWAIDEMLIKKSAAMVLNWPRSETQTFDSPPFSRKEKPYSRPPSRNTTSK